jgi:hypothetical protein
MLRVRDFMLRRGRHGAGGSLNGWGAVSTPKDRRERNDQNDGAADSDKPPARCSCLWLVHTRRLSITGNA